MLELEDIYQIHRTNKKVLPRLLELLDTHALKIDERISSLNRLKADILDYQGKIHQKLEIDDDIQKREDTHERSSDHQRGPDGRR